MSRSVLVVGQGRAGGSFAGALGAAGWSVEVRPGRGTDALESSGHDLVLLCVPDGAVAEVAARVQPGDAVVAHAAGSLGLDALAPHGRRAVLHPLMTLPDPAIGARRLAEGVTFAVAGDPLAAEVVAALGGRAIAVADEDRAGYHAAACIASNHLVALLGQVERVGAVAGVPLDAYLPLVRATLENVAALGPAGALTGPAARGDLETLERHRAALDPGERDAYDALAAQCVRLAAGS